MLAVACACTLATAAETAPPTVADKAEVAMKALKFSTQAIQDSDQAVYIAQNEAEAALAREHAVLSALNIEDAKRTSEAKAEAMKLRGQLFARQLTYDICIFVMVVCIVAAGIGFSYLQFTERRSMAKRLQPVLKQLAALPADDPTRAVLLAELGGNSGSHAFEMGPIKITSNVIGLVVLGMSLAFFYLYLDRVYTIRSDRAEVGGAFSMKQLKANAPPAPEAAASKPAG